MPKILFDRVQDLVSIITNLFSEKRCDLDYLKKKRPNIIPHRSGPKK